MFNVRSSCQIFTLFRMPRFFYNSYSLLCNVFVQATLLIYILYHLSQSVNFTHSVQNLLCIKNLVILSQIRDKTNIITTKYILFNNQRKTKLMRWCIQIKNIKLRTQCKCSILSNFLNITQ